MEDKIIKILNEENKALDIHEIEAKLGFSSVEELKELLKELNRLEDEYKIYRTRKDKYMLFNNSNLKLGKLLGTKKGYAFVDIEGDDDVFIAQDNLNGAINNDKVVVEITSKKGMRLEGRILKIVERKTQQFVGKVYFKHNKCLIDLDDKKINLNIIVDDDKTLGAVSGHKVIVRLLNKLENNSFSRLAFTLTVLSSYLSTPNPVSSSLVINVNSSKSIGTIGKPLEFSLFSAANRV